MFGEPFISRLEAVCLFPGFKAYSLQTERGSAIWSAIETRKKANRFCGRVLMATPKHNGLRPVKGSSFWKRFASAL